MFLQERIDLLAVAVFEEADMLVAVVDIRHIPVDFGHAADRIQTGCIDFVHIVHYNLADHIEDILAAVRIEDNLHHILADHILRIADIVVETSGHQVGRCWRQAGMCLRPDKTSRLVGYSC